jgi:hypothetical protein
MCRTRALDRDIRSPAQQKLADPVMESASRQDASDPFASVAQARADDAREILSGTIVDCLPGGRAAGTGVITRLQARRR